MPYNPSFKSNLDQINTLLQTNQDALALSQFVTYLRNIQVLGDYSISTWQTDWRQTVYKFGMFFSSRNPDSFLQAIEDARLYYLATEKETLDFIYSEIIWNFYGVNSEYTGPELRRLTRLYPGNPELHNTYSHYFENFKDYKRSILEARIAYRIESQNIDFQNNCFNKEKNYFNLLLKKGKITSAKAVLDDMAVILKPTDYILNNLRAGFYDRVLDHEVIRQSIADGNESILKNIEKERSKLVEILGVFVGILSFIFINVDVVLHALSVRDAFVLMLGMGDIILIFVISISFFFMRGREKCFWEDLRFWVILVAFIFLYLIFKFYT